MILQVLFDDVLQCAIPTYFFSFSMFFILVPALFKSKWVV